MVYFCKPGRHCYFGNNRNNVAFGFIWLFITYMRDKLRHLFCLNTQWFADTFFLATGEKPKQWAERCLKYLSSQLWKLFHHLQCAPPGQDRVSWRLGSMCPSPGPSVSANVWYCVTLTCHFLWINTERWLMQTLTQIEQSKHLNGLNFCLVKTFFPTSEKLSEAKWNTNFGTVVLKCKNQENDSSSGGTLAPLFQTISFFSFHLFLFYCFFPRVFFCCSCLVMVSLPKLKQHTHIEDGRRWWGWMRPEWVN